MSSLAQPNADEYRGKIFTLLGTFAREMHEKRPDREYTIKYTNENPSKDPVSPLAGSYQIWISGGAGGNKWAWVTMDFSLAVTKQFESRVVSYTRHGPEELPEVFFEQLLDFCNETLIARLICLKS